MADEYNDEEIEIPGYQSGGRVNRTGIALVHEGEYIMPAPGSEAEIEPAEVRGHGVINYYFPVEIVVLGSPTEEEAASIEARILERLSDALDQTG
jgi:hypothetical protein